MVAGGIRFKILVIIEPGLVIESKDWPLTRMDFWLTITLV